MYKYLTQNISVFDKYGQNLYNQTNKEKQMAVRNFNDAEKQKLIQIISQGSQVLGEVEDLKGGLKDTVKAIAEELELKPALINKAISVAHKGNYQNIADEMDTLESILNTAGKL
jgi:transposase-like protein